LLELLSDEYNNRLRLGFSVFPSPLLSTSVIESFNTVFSVPYLRAHLDLCVVFDNQALYDICETHLFLNSISYTHINRLIAQTISSLTVTSRFQGDLNPNLGELVGNLVP